MSDTLMISVSGVRGLVGTDLTPEFVARWAAAFGTLVRATGARIVRASLSEPARLIADNAGDEGAVIVERIRAEGDSRGYNA
ncbi:MAG: hypothetical protein WEC54_07410, partial [Gemmatimonadales bacterium]